MGRVIPATAKLLARILELEEALEKATGCSHCCGSLLSDDQFECAHCGATLRLCDGESGFAEVRA
jgi:hypothetical protein